MHKLQYVFELEKGPVIVDTLDNAHALRDKVNQPYKTEYATIEPEEPACGWRTLLPNVK